MVTKEELVAQAKSDGYFNIIRSNLIDIKDTVRFMSLGTQFKDFLDIKLSESLDALYELEYDH